MIYYGSTYKLTTKQNNVYTCIVIGSTIETYVIDYNDVLISIKKNDVLDIILIKTRHGTHMLDMLFF